ncbi:trypsin-like peptidase domain-containing protein [Streptomyces sp. NPDC092129]|uniref:nSTAND1 domain-containing NTPase n=1 Tax=Streptomyces sp. NPDC092129 TaxID=3366010 RepID=UPI00382C1127
MSAPAQGALQDSEPGTHTAVVRVLDGAQHTAGAGFLVADRTVVTCAHVVVKAGSGPGGRVRLAFPHAPGAPDEEGYVRTDQWSAPEALDIAVVELDAPLAGVRPLRLGSAEGCQGHHVKSFGFPAQAPPGGHHGFAVAGDLLPPGGAQGSDDPLLQLTAANDLTTGFSGAPVVDAMTGLVIGMVTAIAAPDTYLKGLGIAYATPSQALRKVCTALNLHDVCPYRELKPFATEHAAWFHGREAAVERVVEALAGQRRAVALLGPSGAGKSSLVQAGVLPALASGQLPDSDRWLPVSVRPEHDLLSALEVAGLLGVRTHGIATAVERRLAEFPDHNRVLLIVDQFEELLSHTSPDGQTPEPQRAALREIAAAVTSDAALTVLLVMRDDFYPRLAALAPDLLDAVAPGLMSVQATLSKEDLHAIVTRPAEAVGAHFEKGLADRIVTDILAIDPDEAGAQRAPVTVLPLLELTLHRLWQRRRKNDGHLTHQGYQALGKVSGGIATWCDDVVRQLPQEARPTVRRILTALVRPADEAHHIPAVRQQVPLAVLRELAEDTTDGLSAKAREQQTEDVLSALTRDRVVVTRTAPLPGQRDDEGEPVAELIHEALIREWGTLRAWVGRDRDFQDWLRRSRERWARWRESSRSDDLLGGSDLEAGVEWSQQRGLPGDIAAFLAVSRRAAARRRRVRRTVITVIVALALIASGTAVVALFERDNAVAQRHSAVARLVAAESERILDTDPGLAKQLALTSYRLDPDTGSGPLLAALAAPGVFDSVDAVSDMAQSPDGHTLVMSTDGGIAIWSMSGHARARIAGPKGGPLALTPNGHVLAATTGAAAHTVRLWDLTDPARPHDLSTLGLGGDAVTALATSADGRYLAAGTKRGAIELWDVSAPRAPRQLAALPGHRGEVDSLAFSPTRPTLASSGADHKVRLWDVSASGRQPSATVDGFHGDMHRSSAYRPVAHRLAFTSDGAILATPGDGNNSVLRFWSTAPGKPPRQLAAPTSDEGPTDLCVDGLLSVSFSPDNGVLATVCSDSYGQGRDQLWQTHSMADVTPVHTLSGVNESFNGPAVFAPSGRVLLHATGAGVQQWDAGDPYQPGAAGSYGARPDGFDVALAFSPGPRRLLAVVGGDSGKVIDVTGQPPHRDIAHLPGGYIGAEAAAFSADGKILADSEHIPEGHDKARLVLRLRDTTKAGLPVIATVDGIDRGVHGLAFTPDSHILAVDDNNEDRSANNGRAPTVKLFDLTDAAHPRQVAQVPADAFHIALSPNGRLLIADTDDALLSWNISDPHHPVALPARYLTPGTQVSTGVFRPDGHWLAVGDSSGTFRIFRIADDRIVGDPTTFHVSGYLGETPAFSPDGNTFVLSSVPRDTPIGQGEGSAHLEIWNTRNPRAPLFQASAAFQPDGAISGGNVAFSTDGVLLATTISDSIDVWNVNPSANTDAVCATVGDVITRSQWSRYVPHEAYRPPCARPNAVLPYVTLGSQQGS